MIKKEPEHGNLPPAPTEYPAFDISPRFCTKMLFGIAATLWFFHLAIIFLKATSSFPKRKLIKKLTELFDLDMEANLPTYFSSLILLIAALLLLLSGKLAPATARKKWLLLAYIFIFMSVDEAVQIHEKLLDVTSQLAGSTNGQILTWVWVVPYGLIMISIAIYLLPWLLHLPTKTRNRFFTAGFIYVLGVLVVEIIEGHVGKMYGWDHYLTIVCYTIQEIIEMIGIILFIDALLQHISMLREGNILLLHFVAEEPMQRAVKHQEQSMTA